MLLPTARLSDHALEHVDHELHLTTVKPARSIVLRRGLGKGGASIATRKQVFLSYSHADKHFSRGVEIALDKSESFKAWVDRSIRAGQDWRGEIADAILRSSALVFILSPNSATSRYCREEIYFAKVLTDLLVLSRSSTYSRLTPYSSPLSLLYFCCSHFAQAHGVPILTLVHEDWSSFDALPTGMRLVLQRRQAMDCVGLALGPDGTAGPLPPPKVKELHSALAIIALKSTSKNTSKSSRAQLNARRPTTSKVQPSSAAAPTSATGGAATTTTTTTTTLQARPARPSRQGGAAEGQTPPGEPGSGRRRVHSNSIKCDKTERRQELRDKLSPSAPKRRFTDTADIPGSPLAATAAAAAASGTRRLSDCPASKAAGRDKLEPIDVVILWSGAQRDEPVAHWLADCLRPNFTARQAVVRYDLDGRDTPQAVALRIKAATCVIVIVSPEFARSHDCLDELLFAHEAHKRLLGVGHHCDATMLPLSAQVILQQVNVFDWGGEHTQDSASPDARVLRMRVLAFIASELYNQMQEDKLALSMAPVAAARGAHRSDSMASAESPGTPGSRVARRLSTSVFKVRQVVAGRDTEHEDEHEHGDTSHLGVLTGQQWRENTEEIRQRAQRQGSNAVAKASGAGKIWTRGTTPR